MNTETTVAQQSPVGALDGVFDALVKAVAERIVAQMMDSPAVEAKISSMMETVVDDHIDNWFANNFSIHDYDSEINQMINLDDVIRDNVRELSFTISVD